MIRCVVRLVAVVAALHLGTSAAESLPQFPANNVPATFFGSVVDDPYRGLENVSDPAVAAWMKAHADYARSTLDALPGYSVLRSRISELDAGAAAIVGNSVSRTSDGNLFFTRRAKNENTFKLYRRDAKGMETRLVDPDDWEKTTGKPHAINYFSPSPSGQLVAFGVSATGSEDASIYVIDTRTGERIGAPIDRAQFPEINWRPDGKAFFFFRQQEMKTGVPATERYQNGRAWLHVIGTDASQDSLVAGPGVSSRMDVAATDFVFVVVTPGSRYAVGLVVSGVQQEFAAYAAPLDALGTPDAPWVKICDPADRITDFAVSGDRIYLRTYRSSSRYSIISTDLGAPNLSTATTIIPASQQVLVGLYAAKDGLYVETREGAVKRLKRLAWNAAKPADVKFPIEGAASVMGARADIAGVIAGVTGWQRALQIYEVDVKGRAKNTGLQPLGAFDTPTDLVTTEATVRSHDGAMVPLSIVHKKSVKLDGSNPTLLYGYGSYGITEQPSFDATRLAWLERGGVYAVANVRGSAVYGEDWYKAGYKATKPNTWKDLIACAEYLIDRKYTTRAKLGILGGSAGGILVGRAMTERPDLFAAVIPVVGVLDAVRAETTANGVPNTPEFGTVTREDEFRGLLEMSSYHQVKDQTPYPAVLLIHGVDDPRVNVWHSSKMAARLMAASTSGRPILLDLDYQAGHGVGSTKAQRQQQTTDIYAFLFWPTGVPAFQPAKK
jgi:prolyl oligopeptidase